MIVQKNSLADLVIQRKRV